MTKELLELSFVPTNFYDYVKIYKEGKEIGRLYSVDPFWNPPVRDDKHKIKKPAYNSNPFEIIGKEKFVEYKEEDLLRLIFLKELLIGRYWEEGNESIKMYIIPINREGIFPKTPWKNEDGEIPYFMKEISIVSSHTIT